MAEKGRRRRAALAAWSRNNAPAAMAALYLAIVMLALSLLELLAH